MKTVFIGIILIILAGCASTPTAYQPAVGSNAYGWRDTPIEENRYRVSYRAATPEEARSLALRRAADLTIARGYDWFEVISESTEVDRQSGVRPSVSIGGGTRSGNTGVGIGIGVPLGQIGGGEKGYVSLEILMNRGEKPAGRNAYDARSVLSAMGR